MGYINKFDFIVENVAQARSILNKNNISYDNPTFQEILKATKRDGYTGIVTKLVFELGLGVSSALNLYETMKKNFVDVGSKEIRDILNDEDISNTKKISQLIQVARKEKEKNYEYLFTENDYKVFRINNYEGILEMGSPAWCLKTKSSFDFYTKTKLGMQFVAVHEKFIVIHNNEILLTVPNTWDGEHYTSGSYAKMRFGITVYPNGKMDIFDDSNIVLYYDRVLSNIKYNFLLSILNKLSEYHRENYVRITGHGIEDFDDMKDLIISTMEELGMKHHFSEIAQKSYRENVDEKLKEFYDRIERETGKNKDAFLTDINRFKEQILGDGDFTQHDGYRDIFVNHLITHNAVGGEIVTLPDFPSITAREHPLGGDFFDEQEIGDTCIKYSYGYQYTKYGKAGIEQGFGSLHNYYDAISKYFVDIMVDDSYVSINTFNNASIRKTSGGMTEFKKELKNCIKRQEYKDGYEIIIDIEQLFRLVDKLGIGYGTYNLEKREYENILYKDATDLSNRMKNDLTPWFRGIRYGDDTSFLSVPICTV